MRMLQVFEKSLIGLLMAAELVDVTKNDLVVSEDDFNTVYIGTTNFSPSEIIEFGEKYGVLQYKDDGFYTVNVLKYDEMVAALSEFRDRFKSPYSFEY